MAVPQNPGSIKLFIKTGLIWFSLHCGRQAHGRKHQLLFACRWPSWCSLKCYCSNLWGLTVAMPNFSPNLPNSPKMRVNVSSWLRAGYENTWFLGLYLSLLWGSLGQSLPRISPSGRFGRNESSCKRPGKMKAEAASGMPLLLFCQSIAIRSD